MKKLLFTLFVLGSFYCNQVLAQTTVLVYSENFENGAPGTMLNATGNGNNSGNNQWVITDDYSGSSLYPDTPDQNQVSGGNISYAPYSKYLHVFNHAGVINNCNYDPTNASDRFVQLGNGFCTLGLTNVKMTFFYLCGGSATAYAELYYSVNNGPWTSTGTHYFNQLTTWQYTIVQDTAFDNAANLRFGFRWENNSISQPGRMAFGIDDIFITGDFDNSITGFNVIVDSVSPSPICQNFGLNVYYHLIVPICGNGLYEVQLSDATGSFAPPVSLGINPAGNQWMNGNFWPTIPGNTPAGNCYKVRIKYYFNDYNLTFYSNTSPCFVVQHCPNTITTLQPAVTNGSDSICIGSVMDVPFYSTGAFQSNNIYIAELSDSSGNFPSSPNVIGSVSDPHAYDPALGSPPGSIGGQINANNHPVYDGCGYYIRVRSTNPATTGMVWGPFCIKHCDIETNHKSDIHACINNTHGFDTTIFVHIHSYNSSAIYAPINQFQLEVHDFQSFSVVGTVGALGSITANNDTTMALHIPTAGGLGALDLQPGMYYVRIIATNSNHSYDVLGTIIHLIIGAPGDNLYILQTPSDSVFCVGDVVYLYPLPYNAGPPMNSTYVWRLNGQLFATTPDIGILFTSINNYNVTVQETNYGCPGPVTQNSVILHVLGPPNASIIGPVQVCLGDTLYYHTNFQPNVYTEWSTTGGSIIDSAGTEFYIVFDTSGVYTISLLALDKCGQAVGHKNVIVKAYPDASFSAISPVCADANSVVNYTGSSSPPLTFSWNFDGGIASPGGNNPGPHNVYWITPGQYDVIMTVTQYGCSSKDTVGITVDTCAGINDMNKNNFITMHPNPANDHIIIENSGSANGVEVFVYSDQGLLLYEQELLNTETKLDIRNFAKGVYFVRFEDEHGFIVKKFIKD